MKKEIFILTAVCILLFSAGVLNAQTAESLEAILNESRLSCSQAAEFVLASCAGTASAETTDSTEDMDSEDTADQGSAFEQAAAMGWFPKRAAPDKPITLGTLSFLCMKAFDIKGGLMYMILPGPRYAFRTMTSRSLIQGAADPAMTVSGERFLQILGNVLSAAGGEE